jgi:hypothetical protein
MRRRKKMRARVHVDESRVHVDESRVHVGVVCTKPLGFVREFWVRISVQNKWKSLIY